jgi:hypothetical protein
LQAVYDTDDAPVPSDISEVLDDAQNAVVGGLIADFDYAQSLIDRETVA